MTNIVTGSVQAGTGVLSAGLNIAEIKAKLKSNHSHMEEKFTKLHKIKCSIEDKLQKYWFRHHRVASWLSEVQIIEGEVSKLKTKYSNIRKSTISELTPHYGLTQNIDRKCTEIDKLIDDGKKLEDALVKTEIYRVVKFTKLIKLENVRALTKKLDDLLTYVKDETHNSIKVHGEPGTGKSVLIQHLNNHEAIAKMFDIVIFLPASEIENLSKDCSIEARIRFIIAKRLGLSNGRIEDENVLASKLHEELDGAKYLLLMENVKEKEIALEAIGIPTNTKGSKIVYTTNLPVTPFGTPFGVWIQKLEYGDSWNLFENILMSENNIMERREITSIARKVVGWCYGRFSLIRIVAQNFKSKESPKTWSHGWGKLSTSAEKGAIYLKAMQDFLHFSYDGLKENEKNCFLFSLLYPNEYKIPVDCLFDCWAANGLLGEDMIGEVILERLLAMALFKEGSNKQYVTIDKVCRGAAITILQKHEKFKSFLADEAPTHFENSDWEDKLWISLANSGIVLPMKGRFPKLTTLFLQNNKKLENISSSTYDHMCKLLVLDLHKTGFNSMLLMSHLQMLKVLYVNGCALLKEISFKMDHDSRLEVLDIRGCIISEIPDDIKRLKNLRRLIVSIDYSTPADLKISELSSLNELIIDVKSDADRSDVIEAVIKKIDTLAELTAFKFHFKDEIVDVIQVWGDTLRIYIPKQDSLEKIWSERRKDYSDAQVYIGFSMTSTLEIPEFFDSFLLSCDKIVSDPVIEQVLVKVKAVIMMKNNSVEHLDQTGISHSSMNHIHHCLFHRCNKIETLVQNDGFPNLETLVLRECSQLKALFMNNSIQKPISIKHLEIRDCTDIEEINMLSTSGGDILPKLTTLIFHNLQKLKKICSDMKWPEMITLDIHKCPMLKEMPLNEDSAQNLRTIKVEKKWWENLPVDSYKQKFHGSYKFSD